MEGRRIYDLVEIWSWLEGRRIYDLVEIWSWLEGRRIYVLVEIRSWLEGRRMSDNLWHLWQGEIRAINNQGKIKYIVWTMLVFLHLNLP